MCELTAKDIIQEANNLRKKYKNPSTGVPTPEDHLWVITCNIKDLKEELKLFKTENSESHNKIYNKLDDKMNNKLFLWLMGAGITIVLTIFMFTLQKLYDIASLIK